MDSSLFERFARPGVLLLLYAVAAGAVICALWLAGAFVQSVLCEVFHLYCPPWR